MGHVLVVTVVTRVLLRNVVYFLNIMEICLNGLLAASFLTESSSSQGNTIFVKGYGLTEKILQESFTKFGEFTKHRGC